MPAQVRAGIERALQQAEAAQDTIIPVYEEAYAARTPEDPWVVQDVIAPGVVTFISSKPGVGKTTMLLAYFAAAREGGVWLGRRVAPHRILFVTEEGQRSLWDKRERFGPMQHVRLHSLGFPSLPEDWDEQIRVIKMVAQRWDVRVVIFDPIFSFFHVDDESSSARVRPGLNRLRYITDAGMAVIGAFHDTKSGSPFSGTIAIPGACDVALSLGASPDQDPTHRSLVFARHRLIPDVVNPDRPLTVTMHDTAFIIVENAPAAARTFSLTPEHRILLLLLQEEPSGVRYAAWKDACHDADTILRLAAAHRLHALHRVPPLSKATFDRRRNELFEQGYVLHDTSTRLYTISERGQEALRAVTSL
jgi:AAA domain